MKGQDPNIDREIEEAIKFLVHSIEGTGNNEKPVIIHSIRVGLYLYERSYNKTTVIVGILHDLLEDSETKLVDIEKGFGKKVANLVFANSFDKTIRDKRKRYFQTFERYLNVGKDALVIKAADILDNSYYYSLAPDDLHLWLLEKMKHFIDHSAPIIKREEVWKDLNEQYKVKFKQLHRVGHSNNDKKFHS